MITKYNGLLSCFDNDTFIFIVPGTGRLIKLVCWGFFFPVFLFRVHTFSRSHFLPMLSLSLFLFLSSGFRVQIFSLLHILILGWIRKIMYAQKTKFPNFCISYADRFFEWNFQFFFIHEPIFDLIRRYSHRSEIPRSISHLLDAFHLLDLGENWNPIPSHFPKILKSWVV